MGETPYRIDWDQDVLSNMGQICVLGDLMTGIRRLHVQSNRKLAWAWEKTTCTVVARWIIFISFVLNIVPPELITECQWKTN